jgi:hypothetical protein
MVKGIQEDLRCHDAYITFFKYDPPPLFGPIINIHFATDCFNHNITVGFDDARLLENEGHTVNQEECQFGLQRCEL